MDTIKKIISGLLFLAGALFALFIIPATLATFAAFGKVENPSELIGILVAQIVFIIVNILIFKIAIGLWRGEKMKISGKQED